VAWRLDGWWSGDSSLWVLLGFWRMARAQWRPVGGNFGGRIVSRPWSILGARREVVRVCWAMVLFVRREVCGRARRCGWS
jgi:hypothetical protein